MQKKGKILQTHHIVYRSNGGTDRADNLITVCKDCHTHAAHEHGGVLYKWQKKHKKVRQYKEPPFMNVLRRRMFDRYPNACFTYGSVTTPARKAPGLDKSHVNDTITVSGAVTVAEIPQKPAYIIQVRSKKRSLHEATPRKSRTGHRKERQRTRHLSKGSTSVTKYVQADVLGTSAGLLDIMPISKMLKCRT